MEWDVDSPNADVAVATEELPRLGRPGRAPRSPIVKLLARRAVASVGVVFLVSLLVFLFIHAAPGGPENALVGRDASELQRQAVRQKYNLDDSLISQYGSYLSSLVQFDLGQSIMFREPVTTVLWRAASKVTMPLLAMTVTLSTVFGVTLGYLAARARGSILDRTIVGFTVLAGSTPVFATGMFVAYVFGVRLRWFPFLGSGDGGLDTLAHLVLPAVTTTAVLLAQTMKLSRVRFSELLDEDYVTFARARGLSRRYVVGRVLIRNAAVQIVTWLGSLVVTLVGGLVIVEMVFGLDGLGTELIRAINSRDVPMVQGITLVVAVLAVTTNLLVDLVCMVIDPRIRRGMRPEA